MMLPKTERPALLTDDQMLEELYARASPAVTAAIRKRFPKDGVLPLHAIKKDLRLVPVRAWKRLPDESAP